MKHPLIIWLILFLLVTALLAAGWTERLCNIIDGLNASSDSPQMLAASSGSPASARSRSSTLRLAGLVSTSGDLLQSGSGDGGPAIPTGTPASPLGESPPNVSPEVVPFLDKPVSHQDFPLDGSHDDSQCLNCHGDGRYTGTSSTCESCHGIPLTADELLDRAFVEIYKRVEQPDPALANDLYPDHFGDRCEECHDSGSWKPVSFDHKGIYECISCHAGDIPLVRIEPDPIFLSLYEMLSFVEVIHDPDHYPGDCQLCHTSTTDWSEAYFGHEYVLECESCHLDQLPENHYPGRCTDCHSNYDYWPDAIVNHEHLEDCLLCHSTQVPDGHILGSQPGQCSLCHTTVAWEVHRYNHVLPISCTTCHSKPSGHYSGDCSQCHNTRTWVPDDFYHSNAGDCQGCHSSPDNHYSGSCSTCHTTRGWRLISYNHSEVRECATCHNPPGGHYPGTCSTCHNFEDWGATSFDHLGYLYCIDCHAADEPDSHYSDDCYACHDVNSWENASRYHSSTSDCFACHAPPAGHYGGQCSKCHNTVEWYAVEFDHSGYTQCSTCHTAPSGHWPGACSDCHTTTDWSDYTFNHTGYTTCNACHAHPQGHPRGQCSKCHTTDTWRIILTPTATLSVSPTYTNTPTPRTKPGQSATPAPTATPQQTATPTPQPTPTLGLASTPTLPPSDVDPTAALTPVVGTLQPDPVTTLTAYPTQTPALQPRDPKLIPTPTPQPGIMPRPGLTPLPLPVSTICLSGLTPAPLAGSGTPPGESYLQVITRVFDQTMRLILTSYNSSWKDDEPPPTWRRPHQPTVR